MQKDIIQNEGHDEESKGGPTRDIQVYQIVSDFIKDREGVRLYRRAEKICKAYFLLTQHIQDNDSIKLKLRSLALDMSSKTLSLATSLNKTEDLSRDIVTSLMALVSVSDIAVGARFISEANYSLVVYQVQIFINEVDTYWKTSLPNNQVLSVQMFDVESLDASYTSGRAGGMSFSMGDVSDNFEKNNSDKKISNTIQGGINSGGISGTSGIKNENTAGRGIARNTQVVRPASRNVSASPVSNAVGIATNLDNSANSINKEIKNERQSLILSTISARGESSIKDLTDVIKGCSEKTIQRELIALVDSGSLLKTGERRWSRYSIAR